MLHTVNKGLITAIGLFLTFTALAQAPAQKKATSGNVELVPSARLVVNNPPQVTEQELKACLQQELSASEQFDALNKEADVLKERERALRTARGNLEADRMAMNKTKPSATDIARYNIRIDVFNRDSADFNTDKEALDRKQQALDNWIGTTLKPACNPVQNKPVPVMVSYYACEWDKASSPLQALPFCSSLENRAELTQCAASAGNKANALEQCSTRKAP